MDATDVFFSVDSTKSFKYLLAKVWFLTPFLLGTLLVVRRPGEAWRFAAVYVAGACLSVLYVASRHATKGFSFADVNWALHPFFRNHVIYATVLALLVPFALLAGREARSHAARLGWRVALGILLFGLLTSYTRASIVSVPLAALYFLVLRLRPVCSSFRLSEVKGNGSLVALSMILPAIMAAAGAVCACTLPLAANTNNAK